MFLLQQSKEKNRHSLCELRKKKIPIRTPATGQAMIILE